MPTNRTEDGNDFDFFLQKQNASNMKNEKCCSSLMFGNQIFLLLPSYQKIKLKTTSEEPKLCRNNDFSVQRFFINLVGSNQNKNMKKLDNTYNL
jgi:hypothetical protein